jgi:hypothetical protein
MNFIELIFRLLEHFAPIADSKLKQLELDGTNWYNTTIAAQPEEGKKEFFIIPYLRQYGEAWYTKVALAILFMFSVRWVRDFMEGNKALPDDEETF